MPTLKFPLVGSYNNRSFAAVSGKDQFFKGCIITRAVNKALNAATWYAEKRTGANALFTPDSGASAITAYYSPTTGYGYAIYVDSSGATLFRGTDNCGDVGSGSPTSPIGLITCEIVVSGITYVMLTYRSVSESATGWYLASDAVSNTAYTADGNNSTTITDIKISGVNSVAGLYVGQKLTAASNGITGKRIVSINAGAFSAVLDGATTGGAFNDLAITKEPIAKITDAEFPSNAGETIVGGFVELDGYLNIMTQSGRVYQSDINTPVSWGASNYLTCSKNGGTGLGVLKYRDYVPAFTTGGFEFLYNAGNTSGSTMSSLSNSTKSSSIVPNHAMSAISAFGNVFWVGNDGNLYQLDGYSAKPISNIGNTPVSAVPALSYFVLSKQQFINIRLSSTANMWYSISGDYLVDPNLSAGAFLIDGLGSAFIYLVDTGGKYYSFTTNQFQDNGSAFTMSIQIGTDMGTNKRKFVSEFRHEGDVQASGTLSVSYSDDDGATYSTAQTIDLTTTRQRLTGTLGSFVGKRLWKLEHSANTPYRAERVEIDYEVAV